MKSRTMNLGIWAVALLIGGTTVFTEVTRAENSEATPVATNALVSQLTALQEAVNGVDSAGKPLMDPNYRSASLQTLGHVERFIEQKDYPKAIQMLENLNSYQAQASSEFRKLLKSFSAMLVAQVDARRADQVKQVRAALAEIEAACAMAKSAADLQLIQSRIQQMQSSLSSLADTVGPEMNEIRNNLSVAQDMVRQWGEVLVAESSGDLPRALARLNQIASSSASWMIGDRSKIMQQRTSAKRAELVQKMMEQPELAEDPLLRTVTEELARADTIEKLFSLRRRLAMIQRGNRYDECNGGFGGSGDLQNLLAELQVLESWQSAMTAGQYNQCLASSSIVATYSHRWKPVTARFVNQLRGRAMAEMAGVKELKVADGQTAEQAMLQLARAAKAAKDWSALVVSLDVYRLAVFGAQPGPVWLGDGIRAGRQMVAGHRFEQVGDVERAAVAYMAVLTAVSDFAPVEDARADIARLQKDHPDILQRIRDIPEPPEATMPRHPAAL